MRRISKRGTEKPIEIFVALFVILAVALVMLKLFQSQITEKQKQLSDFQQEQKAKELKQKVQLHCQEKCTEASNNGCSMQSLAALCLANSGQVLSSGEFLDLDGDNKISFNVDDFGGEGVCENRVYCFNGMISNCCARQIDSETCSSILRQYWTERGFNTTEISTLCKTYLSSGDCSTTVGTKDMSTFAWWRDFTKANGVCESIPLGS